MPSAQRHRSWASGEPSASATPQRPAVAGRWPFAVGPPRQAPPFNPRITGHRRLNARLPPGSVDALTDLVAGNFWSGPVWNRSNGAESAWSAGWPRDSIVGQFEPPNTRIARTARF